MVRSPTTTPALPPPARGTRLLWPLTRLLTPLAFAAGMVPLVGVNIGAAVAYGAVALLVVGALELLRGRHREAASDAARWRAEAERVRAEAEEARAEAKDVQAELDSREAHWQGYVRNRAELVRAEVEFTVTKRLPVALSRTEEVPKPLHTEDELGPGVTEWLDRMLTAVTDASDDREESQRLSLVELASRVQTSAHRIQATVTGLADRYPGDADLLETTMLVDHAATQQARHAQSLKVLCGEWPGQQWQRPLALVDVVRAASGRIVAFRRVEVSGDPDVGVTPSAVEPLIHLIAELLANATEYSPPKTGVPVTVRTVQRGAVIEVDDGGLGLDEYRLAEAREIVSGRRLLGVGDVGEIPRTGFAVVGRFAERHGFQVDLGPSPYGGVRAVVLVPVDVLHTLAPAGTPAGRVLPSTLPVPEVPTPAPAPENAPGDLAPADPSAVPPSAQVPTPAPAPAVDAPDGAPPRTGPRLPQRRSRREEYEPGAATVPPGPTAVTPPGSPEEAGDWMEQFFEGGRTLPPSGESAATDTATDEGPHDVPPSATPLPPEGQT
ncbi:ATP-binding protein [Streptomyces sp. NBC_01716]|uniref:ATP-binding protein n=1 Tax=Streptomyces sp. NBC_01716 TaxID=2975917 RepID=UPI002E323277|nr:ATP-binding protein [Streptomyces sp. NBC_01716]